MSENSIPPRVKNLIGRRFGRLVVMAFDTMHVRPDGQRLPRWICKCDCGNTKAVVSGSLISGGTRSCKCFLVESVIARQTKHGQSRGSHYAIHRMIIDRCENTNHRAYHRYGGRGIRMCDRWRGENGLLNFIADVGERPSPQHTIDRYPDKNGNYEPGNVRWATRKEQSRNRRDNVILTLYGESLTMAEWCERTGISRSTLKNRLHRDKMTVEQALTTPIRVQ